MDQLIQNLKDGDMKILEVPFPGLPEGNILVKNHYSVISAGTEGKTVKDARAGYLEKARSRKDEVKKIFNTAKKAGIIKTYQMVMNRLESPVPLGYSCCGEVIETGSAISGFKVGDRVACGGNTANHAEVVSVPANLCVKLQGNVDLRHAAFTTLGAIALQGIRQADLKLGECCAVIGVGLIGQLTIKMLSAAGINAVGIDIDPSQVALAKKAGISDVIQRDNEFLMHVINDLSAGHGVDAVIITAATSSTDPVDLAGELCRQKGKVIIVGSVPTGFKRTNYFKKELELKMSSSYGPGRYDTLYEEGGVDYPYGYVRWTENRNMMAFADLLATRRIDIEALITHQLKFNDAKKAYDLIINKSEPFSGIILDYTNIKLNSSNTLTLRENSKPGYPVAAFIGAGSFTQNILLPAAKNLARLRTITTSKSVSSRHLADKYKFENCTGDASAIFSDPQINTVFIATRHNSHAEYVIKGLRSDKNVFVEKPLCMNLHELDEIKSAYEASRGKLMTGFNRRFAPFTQIIAADIHSQPGLQAAINFRINAGALPANHWINDPKTGGGRILGEACHFIDLAIYISNSKVISVSATELTSASSNHDTCIINLAFANGSVASISYFSNGNNSFSKELLEVFYANQVAVIDDFKTLRITGKKNKNLKSGTQDKGHQNEISQFLTSIKEGHDTPISFEEQYHSMYVTFAVLESINSGGERISINSVDDSTESKI
jgi:predicted dehydrogenase